MKTVEELQAEVIRLQSELTAMTKQRNHWVRIAGVFKRKTVARNKVIRACRKALSFYGNAYNYKNDQYADWDEPTTIQLEKGELAQKAMKEIKKVT